MAKYTYTFFKIPSCIPYDGHEDVEISVADEATAISEVTNIALAFIAKSAIAKLDVEIWQGDDLVSEFHVQMKAIR